MEVKLKRRDTQDAVVFDARRLDATNAKALLRWIDDAAIAFTRNGTLTFVTLGGSATIGPGDWVLKNPADGRFYPTCRHAVRDHYVRAD